MLDANENIPKNDKSLKDWINEQTKDKDGFLEIHIIPIVNFDLENFSNFIERRRKMLIEKLKIILN